jgi:hypothetical protein
MGSAARMIEPEHNPPEMALTPAAPLGMTGIASLARRSSDRLARRLEAGAVRSTFTFRGFLFALLAERHGPGARLRLHAHLGNLPYSAESDFARINAAAIIQAASEGLGGRIVVSPHQRIFLIEEKLFGQPLDAVTLVENATRLVLEAWPFLELLAVVVPPPMLGPSTARA